MATSYSSDQTTLLMDTIASDTLSRAGRARITSIQGKGIASSVLKLHDCATAGAAAAGTGPFFSIFDTCRFRGPPGSRSPGCPARIDSESGISGGLGIAKF